MSDNYVDSEYEDEPVDTELTKPTVVRRRPAKKASPRKSAGHVPARAPKPQDRKKSAAQREAEGDEFVYIEYEGEEFKILADQDEWPTVAIQAFSNQKMIDAVEHLLGPQQWARFNVMFPKVKHFNEFGRVVAQEFGFGVVGE
jgi:hypothetical protein